MIKDNPATRLYNILHTAKNQDGIKNGIDVWAAVLNTERDPLILSKRLAQVQLLPARIYGIICKDYPSHKKAAERVLERVSSLFLDTPVRGKWLPVTEKIDQGMLDTLSFISTTLDSNSRLPAIANEEYDNLKKEFEELLFSVQDDHEMEYDLRKYLIDSITHILDVIDTYQLTGLTPIVDAVSGITGQVLLDKNLQIRLSGTPSGTKFFQTVIKATKYLGIFNSGVDAIENMKKLLGLDN